MEKAILKTLAYADIFDYPLTADELHRFLIGESVRRNTQYVKRKTSHILCVSYRDGFYCLKGREEIVSIRKKRKRWSQEKLKIAQRITGWLRLIPTIKMVAVTGALAMMNSDKEDDIDLLIITSKNQLWLSRGLVVTFLRLVGLYRRPGKIKNKICPNMFLDEKHLEVPKKEQDLFSAHEVCQLKPIWDRNNCYQKFLKANLWSKKYLPNGLREIKKLRNREIKGIKEKNYSITQLLNYFIQFLEQLAYRLQLTYMRTRRTTEITDSGRILFHPKDARDWILKEYKEELDKLGIK